MAASILKLNNVMKIYILGSRKNARKAQKAIQKLENKYEKQIDKKDKQAAKTEELLKKAQLLFADEKYEDSFAAITGKRLKARPKDRGAVVHALRGIDLEIQPGELTAVMGPSGSGKSTLLNMLGLLDEPTAGQLFLNNRSVSPIKKPELPEIRSHQLGFVFQSFNLVPTLTALENVMLPLKYAGIHNRKRLQMAKKVLEQVGLGDRLHHRSHELSGGQQQRVAIARSIVNGPAIVFGDELTGELDSKMTADIMKLISKLNKAGQTFVIVTHNPDVAKVCRRIIYMKDGTIEKEVKK
jgi:putative ABC transport system ATP-binding protein